MPLHPGEVEKGRLIYIVKKEGIGVSETIEDGTVLRKGPAILPVRAYGQPARFSRKSVQSISRIFGIDSTKF